MRRRPRRGTAAALTALAVLTAAVLVAVVAIQLIIGERPWVDYDSLAARLHDTRWRDWGVALAGGIVAVAGLLMLLAALLPGRLTILPLRGDREGIDSGASRRSLRGTLRRTASTVDGVRTARLRLRRKRVTAVVRTHRTNPDGLDDAVRAALTRRLDQVGPLTPAEVRVRVAAPRSGS